MLLDNTPLVMVFVYGFFVSLLMAIQHDLWHDEGEDFTTLVTYALYGAAIMTAVEGLSRLF